MRSSEEEIEEFDSDTDNDATEDNVTAWTKLNYADCKPPFVFTNKLGFTNRPNSFDNELDAFRYFMSDELAHFILQETNRFGSDLKAEARENARASNFTEDRPISQDKLFFLGFCFLMGIVKKPTILDYWSEESILCTPIFSRVMPRNCFQP